jgi:uracil DNA glycosylase
LPDLWKVHEKNLRNPAPWFVFRPWQIPPKDVKIIIIASGASNRDKRKYSLSGLALSGTDEASRIVLEEYSRDLKYSIPRKATLLPWHMRGVMLINYRLINTHAPIDKHTWKRLMYETLFKLSSKDDKTKRVLILCGTDTWFLSDVLTGSRYLVLRVHYPGNRFDRGIETLYGSGIFSTALNFLGLPRQFLKLPRSKDLS